MPLDPDTYLKAKHVLDRARTQGHDPVEALEREHLLLTPARRKEIRVATGELILSILESWRPAEMLRRKFRSDASTTPTDMYACVIDWLEEFIATMRKQD